MNELIEKTEENKSRSYVLYLLGYFYYSIGDIFTAKEKLRECIKLKSRLPVEKSASELVDYIWTYEIRPVWWRWWLSSPLYSLRRKVVFSVLLSLIFLLLFFHPFISELIPFTNWYVYIILIMFLIFILLSPNIRGMKIGELDVELSSFPPTKPDLSPPQMEKMMNDIIRSTYTAGERTDLDKGKEKVD